MNLRRRTIFTQLPLWLNIKLKLNEVAVYSNTNDRETKEKKNRRARERRVNTCRAWHWLLSVQLCLCHYVSSTTKQIPTHLLGRPVYVFVSMSQGIFAKKKLVFNSMCLHGAHDLRNCWNLSWAEPTSNRALGGRIFEATANKIVFRLKHFSMVVRALSAHCTRILFSVYFWRAARRDSRSIPFIRKYTCILSRQLLWRRMEANGHRHILLHFIVDIQLIISAHSDGVVRYGAQLLHRTRTQRRPPIWEHVEKESKN